MIRTIERNSVEETMKAEMEKMTDDFVQSGYNRDKLKKIEAKAFEKCNSNRRNEEEKPTITFPIFHFDEINSFKKIIFDANGINSQTSLRRIGPTVQVVKVG